MSYLFIILQSRLQSGCDVCVVERYWIVDRSESHSQILIECRYRGSICDFLHRRCMALRVDSNR